MRNSPSETLAHHPTLNIIRNATRTNKEKLILKYVGGGMGGGLGGGLDNQLVI